MLSCHSFPKLKRARRNKAHFTCNFSSICRNPSVASRIWAKGWAGPEPALPVKIRDHGGVCIVNSVAYSDSKHLTWHPSQNDAGQGTRLLSGGSEHSPLYLVRNIQTTADKLDSRRNSPLRSFSNQAILVVCHIVMAQNQRSILFHFEVDNFNIGELCCNLVGHQEMGSWAHNKANWFNCFSFFLEKDNFFPLPRISRSNICRKTTVNTHALSPPSYASNTIEADIWATQSRHPAVPITQVVGTNLRAGYIYPSLKLSIVLIFGRLDPWIKVSGCLFLFISGALLSYNWYTRIFKYLIYTVW